MPGGTKSAKEFFDFLYFSAYLFSSFPLNIYCIVLLFYLWYLVRVGGHRKTKVPRTFVCVNLLWGIFLYHFIFILSLQTISSNFISVWIDMLHNLFISVVKRRRKEGSCVIAQCSSPPSSSPLAHMR